MCEEFGCLPTAALREWLDAPAGLLEEIIETRAYARTKLAYDTADEPSKLAKTEMLWIVKSIEEELALEDIGDA